MIGEPDGDLSMLDLFRIEAGAQAEVLTSALLALERDATAADQLELCMRAAHSLKGAARIVGLEAGVRVAHAIEECFVAAQRSEVTFEQRHIDRLLRAADLLLRIANTSEEGLAAWDDEQASGVSRCLAEVEGILSGAQPAHAAAAPRLAPLQPVADSKPGSDAADRVLRVTAESLDRLLGLASESMVQSRWVKSFAQSLLRLKRMQYESCAVLEELRGSLMRSGDAHSKNAVAKALHATQECRRVLTERIDELEAADRRSLNLSHRMYHETLACRMRPFGDGVQGYPRLVRDVAQQLSKQVRLDVAGDNTPVDRDVLARLDAPLGHLLRNAVDHGIETPAARVAAGKRPEGVIRLEARHRAGILQVIVSDDGGGVDIEKIRSAVIARQLLAADAAAKLSDTEVLAFLFLPGFSMKTTVTDISGRGVGLDAVQDMMKQLRGGVRMSSQLGAGTQFVLQLPVTLSVVRTLLADVGGEPYAFPLAHIVRMVKLAPAGIHWLEGRQHFQLDGRRVGLVTAHQVLGLEPPAMDAAELPVIVLEDHSHWYGVVVDRFLGERELVVQRLDPLLGKVKDISAGALLEDGSPALIVDCDEMITSITRLVTDGQITGVKRAEKAETKRKRKRVLIVDDSLTVRELERKLLVSAGYDVHVAVDGMDGWNAVRAGEFELIVTDIDMPRVDGFELVARITGDPKLQSIPVMIVSYKDRDEDRRRGLEAGAAYYLTKGSFHDDRLLQAVVDLIGAAA